MSDPSERTSPLVVAAAWAVVAIPLAWGVYQTAMKARPLLARPSGPATALPAHGTDPGKPTGDRQSWSGKPPDDPVQWIPRPS